MYHWCIMKKLHFFFCYGRPCIFFMWAVYTSVYTISVWCERVVVYIDENNLEIDLNSKIGTLIIVKNTFGMFSKSNYRTFELLVNPYCNLRRFLGTPNITFEPFKSNYFLLLFSSWLLVLFAKSKLVSLVQIEGLKLGYHVNKIE